MQPTSTKRRRKGEQLGSVRVRLGLGADEKWGGESVTPTKNPTPFAVETIDGYLGVTLADG